MSLSSDSVSDPEGAALSASLDGDLRAFERFHRATIARIHSLARRLLGPARAEEAVQEVYLRAWRARASWRGESKASTWLHRLALNVLLNQRTRGRSPILADPEGLAQVPGAPGPSAERLDLEAAIARLPEGARAVLVLHDVEGLKHGEIAARLALSVGTSKSQLHRARALLRAALGEDYPR